jgi:hypothetical protein
VVAPVAGEEFWGGWLRIEEALKRRPLPGSD